jgi:hypothetical protein
MLDGLERIISMAQTVRMNGPEEGPLNKIRDWVQLKRSTMAKPETGVALVRDHQGTLEIS